jgi:Flp pilus assembly protein TadD
MLFNRSGIRHVGLLLAISLATLPMAGCKSLSFNDLTGSISRNDVPPNDPAGLRRFTESWGKRYEANPNDKQVILAYARGLRAEGKVTQAVAVLQQAAMRSPNDLEILGAYGKALADAGRLEEAAGVLRQAHTAERPNWSIYSAQGSVADQLGDHYGAQAFYVEALKLAPGEPSVLSNLGLSYALNKELGKAEDMLRQAAKHPRADARVRQNLALILSLQGKFAEAETAASRDLSAEEAAANVVAIRQMISQSNAWREIQNSNNAQLSVPGTQAPAQR